MSEQRELTERGADRRSQLLEHAAQLFETNGYGKTRITDIASAAGVAKGLFYWYFPSKEALLAELVDEVQGQLRRLQGEATERIDEPLDRLYAGTYATIPFLADHFHLYGVMARASARQDDSPVTHSIALHAKDTANVLLEGQARGVVRADEPAELLAYSVGAVVNELVRFHSQGLLPGTIEDTAALAGRSVVHLVAADPSFATAAIDRRR